MEQTDTTAVSFRTATLADASAIRQLVDDSGVLDPNSPYCYLLLCRDFGDTCVVAMRSDQLVGFVTAYRPPGRQDRLFVWQIGVAESMRGQGMATRLLHSLLELPGCSNVRYMEATVTPSNRASRRLFQSFAKLHSVECHIEAGFPAEFFGEGNHEEEELFRLGPFTD